jgi:splicing factor 1
MSWRGQGVTGSNNIPLGNRRRFGDDSPADDSESLRSRGRSRSPVRELVPHGTFLPFRQEEATALTDVVDAADGIRKRRKKNRWGTATDNKAAGLMGLPTEIKAAMTTEQLDAYILNLRIEEISQKLRINDVVPAEGDRHVTPPLIEISRLIAL